MHKTGKEKREIEREKEKAYKIVKEYKRIYIYVFTFILDLRVVLY